MGHTTHRKIPTLAKYLQGVSTVEISVECENGHALPA